MRRRDFLTASAATLLATGVQAEAQTGASPVGPKRTRGSHPNILLLMADQFRYDCVGANGNKIIRTPNLDRIARESVRFTAAYTCTPSCTPARSALLTGQGPWKHGMLGYSNMATKPYPLEKASALTKAGYFTATIGKNHYFPIRNAHGYQQMVCDEHDAQWWGKVKQVPPAERCDYEAYFWSQRPASNPSATGLSWNDYRARPFVYPEELHDTTWTGQTAVHFLNEYDRPEPFFLKVSFIRPHSPYDAPQRFFDMYEHAALPEPKAAKWADKYIPRSDASNEIWHGRLAPEVMRYSRQGYYGCVTHVDEQIGEVLAALERRGMLNDTLILFCSDHGDMLGDQNLWRKTYGYEQSAHIPMLMRPPSGMDWGHAGQVVDAPVEIRDLLPTFLDAAGAEQHPELDGRSLLQLAGKGKEGWREYIDLEHNVCYSPTNHWNGLTDGKWKYLYHAQAGEEQLFDLVHDPDELEDLSGSAQHSAELAKWRARLVEHLSERGPDWVSNGRLMVRPKGQEFSPNFPGYAAPGQVG